MSPEERILTIQNLRTEVSLATVNGQINKNLGYALAFALESAKIALTNPTQTYLNGVGVEINDLEHNLSRCQEYYLAALEL